MTPESVGLSGNRLQLIDRHLQQRYLEPGRLPGALTLIERRGELAHSSLQGHMDVERARPLQQDTIFRIYSMTKPITSVALMMLVEEGQIALDEPVHRYIPQWRNLGVYEAGFIGTFRTRPVAAPMRIVDLLRHTSGLTYGLQQRTNVDAAYRKYGYGDPAGNGTLEQMIEGLAKIPLEASPGDAWNYSVSTDVVGYLVGTNPARSLIPGSAGDYSWGGMASTYFWIDPREQLIVIFMTQLIPSTIYNLRRELRTLVYSAFS